MTQLTRSNNQFVFTRASRLSARSRRPRPVALYCVRDLPPVFRRGASPITASPIVSTASWLLDCSLNSMSYLLKEQRPPPPQAHSVCVSFWMRLHVSGNPIWCCATVQKTSISRFSLAKRAPELDTGAAARSYEEDDLQPGYWSCKRL